MIHPNARRTLKRIPYRKDTAQGGMLRPSTAARTWQGVGMAANQCMADARCGQELQGHVGTNRQGS